MSDLIFLPGQGEDKTAADRVISKVMSAAQTLPRSPVAGFNIVIPKTKRKDDLYLNLVSNAVRVNPHAQTVFDKVQFEKSESQRRVVFEVYTFEYLRLNFCRRAKGGRDFTEMLSEHFDPVSHYEFLLLIEFLALNRTDEGWLHLRRRMLRGFPSAFLEPYDPVGVCTEPGMLREANGSGKRPDVIDGEDDWSIGSHLRRVGKSKTHITEFQDSSMASRKLRHGGTALSHSVLKIHLDPDNRANSFSLEKTIPLQYVRNPHPSTLLVVKLRE